MSENNFALLTILFLAFVIPIAMVLISHFLGGKGLEKGGKTEIYESGIMQTVGTAQERFSIKFYLTAILFIIFDVEAVFLYPWAVNFQMLAKNMGLMAFAEMVLFLSLLLAGFIYIWKKGALQWD